MKHNHEPPKLRKDPDTILVVEDDDSLREVLAMVLEQEGFAVLVARSAEEALQVVSTESVACVLADFKLPMMNGVEFAKKLRASSAHLPFVIMTAYGSIDIVVDAMKSGASDFITKPFEPQSIAPMLRQVIQHNRIIDRDVSSRKRRVHSIVTKSPSLDKVLAQATKVAAVDTPVLLLGESGSGKEVLARFIHDHSPRHDKPFIAVNCGAIPADLLESEFFGYEAGAFTGASHDRIGIFELAGDGTVFLDEVAEMPPHLQVKLLRVLQEGEIRRLGGLKSIQVRPRIISATNRAIPECLESGALREDFYYRIAVVALNVPPLRERKEDILDLAQALVRHYATLSGRDAPRLDAITGEVLLSYAWPGNVRELENVMERAVLLAGDEVHPEHLGIQVCLNLSLLKEASRTLAEVASEAAQQAECAAIQRALALSSGNKTKAAELLAVSYKTLLSKVREYNLDAESE